VTVGRKIFWTVIVSLFVFAGYKVYQYYVNSYETLTKQIIEKRAELNLMAFAEYLKSLNGKEVSWRGKIYSIEHRGQDAKVSIDMNPEKGGLLPIPDVSFTISNKEAQLLSKGEEITASGRVAKISPFPLSDSFLWELTDAKVH
jgi:hypothetical protein